MFISVDYWFESEQQEKWKNNKNRKWEIIKNKKKWEKTNYKLWEIGYFSELLNEPLFLCVWSTFDCNFPLTAHWSTRVISLHYEQKMNFTHRLKCRWAGQTNKYIIFNVQLDFQYPSPVSLLFVNECDEEITL